MRGAVLLGDRDDEQHAAKGGQERGPRPQADGEEQKGHRGQEPQRLVKGRLVAERDDPAPRCEQTLLRRAPAGRRVRSEPDLGELEQQIGPEHDPEQPQRSRGDLRHAAEHERVEAAHGERYQPYDHAERHQERER
jgi:hypothetical protein